jgi:hypothetical protein
MEKCKTLLLAVSRLLNVFIQTTDVIEKIFKWHHNTPNKEIHKALGQLKTRIQLLLKLLRKFSSFGVGKTKHKLLVSKS